MYQNIYYDRYSSTMYLWDDENGLEIFEYKPYAYKLDERGEYQTLDGRRVTKVYNWTPEDEKNGIVFETDVRPEHRVLIDRYYADDRIAKNHNIAFLDIEVERGSQYSTPEDAINPITAITIYLSATQQYWTFVVADANLNVNYPDVNIVFCKNEGELLARFIDFWNRQRLTIVSGWNVLWYDMLYLYNRIPKVFGGKINGDILSPIRKVQYFESKDGGYRQFKIAGISILDYMDLYKKFTYNEEPKYTLDYIAEKELGRGKVKYDGNLDTLLIESPEKFIEYNIEDVKLVVELDNKLDFIAIGMGVCHKGHVPYEDVFYTSRYMDGACLTELRRLGLVSVQSKGTRGGKAVGAFVKETRAGVYSWVYDLDLTSLYPSIIMSLNISVETKIGKIRDWNVKDFVANVERTYKFERVNGAVYDVTTQQLRDFLLNSKCAIAANGVVYETGRRGIIPKILERWFSERKEFKKLSKEYFESGDREKSDFYNRAQLIQKVLLNSLYGVLLLPSFRYYDKDNGEAVTTTGQQVIQFTTQIANFYYNEVLGTKNIDYCLYTDTDSVFYEALPLIRKLYGDLSDSEIPDKVISVATTVQNVINRAYDEYARRYHNLERHWWEIKQELVAKRAFWGSAKKRYAMRVVREGDKVVDEIIIKGFDSVRSSFPMKFREVLNTVIIMILDGKQEAEINKYLIEFKRDLASCNVFEIGNPTSVKDVDKWVNDENGVDLLNLHKKGAPVHVKAAINYNFLKNQILRKTNYPDIKSGDKIVWFYLIPNKYNFDVIALNGDDDPPELVEFVERFIDREKIFSRGLVEKIRSIYDDLGFHLILNPYIYEIFEYEN